MPKWNVTFEQVRSYDVEVEADNMDDAKAKAEEIAAAEGDALPSHAFERTAVSCSLL